MVAVRGSRVPVTMMKWPASLLVFIVLSTQCGFASPSLLLRVLKIAEDGSIDSITSNPMTFLQDDVAEFSCLCVDNVLTQVELLHNQSSIHSGSCGIHFEITFSLAHEGEYSCQSTFPNGTGVKSPGRQLNILDTNDVIAPSKQYAIYGSSYTLECSTDIEHHYILNWHLARNRTETSQRNSYQITNVSLSDETVYTCDVYFDGLDVRIKKNVSLFIIVPPVIISPLPDHLVITSNVPTSLNVSFQSRFQANTTVLWYHNGQLVKNCTDPVYGPSSDMQGRSSLDLGVVSRSKKGTYRVEVLNSHPSIPQGQRMASSNLELSVNVLPALPSNVFAQNISQDEVQLSWKLTPRHEDESASEITVTLTNTETMEVSQCVVEEPDSVEKVLMHVVPGMWYQSVITAWNTDGNISTQPLNFRAAISGPNVTSVRVSRLNMTSFNISVSLLYTGGGGISHFLVQSRKRNGTKWGEKVLVSAHRGYADRGLDWHGIVTGSRLGEPSEFQVVVVNDQQNSSQAVVLQETLTPLNAPSTPHLISSSEDSLTLSFTLPTQGTPPILHLLINFTAPSHFKWNCMGPHDLGAHLECTVPKLDPATPYTLFAYGVGHAGIGNSSQTVTFTTTAVDKSLPTWVIAVVAVVIAMAVVIAVLALVLVALQWCKVHQKKRLYKFNTKKATEKTSPKPLDPSHAILNRQKKPSLPALSSASEAPSTPHSLTPPSHSTPSTTITFKYETTSNSSYSNLESEVSEALSPTYTYCVSPSLPPPVAVHVQQQVSDSYPALNRLVRIQPVRSFEATRESLASCPPAPTHRATNV